MSDQAAVAKGWVIYPIGSRPPMGLAILLGIQQYLTMFGATVLIPFIVGGAMGLPQEELALLISTMFFVSGILVMVFNVALTIRAAKAEQAAIEAKIAAKMAQAGV